MRIVVTGAAGLVGSRLVEELSKTHEVVGITRFSASSRLRSWTVWGDVREQSTAGLLRTLKPDVVLHLAAIATNTYANSHPLETLDINANGTASLAEACKSSPHKPIFVLASSSEVYGGATDTVDEMSPVRASTPYAASKIAAEEYVRASGLPFVIARPFNTYGRALVGVPVAVPDKAIVSAMTRQEVELWDERPQRDFLFREDHVAAYLSIVAALAESRPAITGETFVFGTGRSASIGMLFEAICALPGNEAVRIVARPHSRMGDVPVLRANSDKAFIRLGWKSHWVLEKGLAESQKEWQRHYAKERVDAVCVS